MSDSQIKAGCDSSSKVPAIVVPDLRRLLAGEIPNEGASTNSSAPCSDYASRSDRNSGFNDTLPPIAKPKSLPSDVERSTSRALAKVDSSEKSIDCDAERIKEEVERAIRSREAAYHIADRSYVLDGLDLMRVKAVVRHGEFEDWCAARLGYSRATARRKMRAATLFGTILKTRTVRDLPPSTLGYLISSKKTPPELQARIVEQILAGNRFEPKAIKAEVKRAIADAAQKNAPATLDNTNIKPKTANADAAERAAELIRGRLSNSDLSVVSALLSAADSNSFWEAMTRGLAPKTIREVTSPLALLAPSSLP